MSDSEDKLAVELLAHKESVAAYNMQVLEAVRVARSEAEFWRSRWCKVMANGSGDYERLVRVNPLAWENEKG